MVLAAVALINVGLCIFNTLQNVGVTVHEDVLLVPSCQSNCARK